VKTKKININIKPKKFKKYRKKKEEKKKQEEKFQEKRNVKTPKNKI
jgi:hypothetical protein